MSGMFSDIYTSRMSLMGWQIVKQPNGMFAIWSTISDSFIFYQATQTEIIMQILNINARSSLTSIRQQIKNEIKNYKYPSFLLRFSDLTESNNKIFEEMNNKKNFRNVQGPFDINTSLNQSEFVEDNFNTFGPLNPISPFLLSPNPEFVQPETTTKHPVCNILHLEAIENYNDNYITNLTECELCNEKRKTKRVKFLYSSSLTYDDEDETFLEICDSCLKFSERLENATGMFTLKVNSKD